MRDFPGLAGGLAMEQNTPMIFASLLLLCAFSEEPKTLDASKLFTKVVAIGASVSDGFQNQMPIGKLFDEAIQGPHEPVESIVSSVFFLDPMTEGPRQSSTALKRKPSLLLGVDYLFWYGYGVFPGSPHLILGTARPDEHEELAKRRLDRLEIGLRELEKFSCPMVLGDFPDMWGADPEMLPKNMIPSAKTIERLNERLYAWAKDKPQVLILPLAAWAKQTKEGKASVPGKEKDGPVPAEVLLQEDRLHPTEAGAVVLTGRIVEEIRKWAGKSAAEQLRFDVSETLKKKHLDLELPSK